MARFTFAAAVVLASVAVVAAQDSSDLGPLTTNNAVTNCVQFGDCTAGGQGSTLSFAPGIQTPAPSTAFAAPTDSAQSIASVSELAASGAAAAFSSRLPGQNSDARGATSVYTGTIAVAGSAPSSVRASGTNSPDGAVSNIHVSGFWAPAAAAVAAVALGAAVVL
ncbi:hypothetical protein IE81DRAFT_347238 [Ceraceosorus guamensis]|uniref:Uncharacterized protein n=1 Tax=Ceraceosorus guamensis TaxID=1522189 RepID=A0A316W1N4_9BASI|nr:hypothetical protein IE81DRAFT_347238 [Ceraceosorus guamensis]PWN42683.1 hypothetical protein IE81DRAFT_347238 [Ceraceosorus guamensis]